MSLERATLTRLSMQRLSKRFSRNKNYDRVDDTSDSRVPLHNEEMFQHGIKFKAKFIGSLEIARPTSKLDIITAMRRIRYEFKVKGLRKKRCVLDVSVNGVKVTKRRRRRMRKQLTESQMFIMEHQIHRIFYVSHDSQDLKIFSYISREAPSNIFRCNVFKAYKQRMALHIVRTLGQAFDVCHKLNPRPKKKKQSQDESDKTEATAEAETRKEEEIKEAEKLNEVEDLDKEFQELALQSTTSDLLNQSTADPFSPGGAKIPNGAPSFDPLDLPLPPGLESTDAPNGTAAVPISHLAYIGRPRPRPSQTTIEENKFTTSLDSVNRGTVSPSASIGEPLSTAAEVKEQSRWTIEKQQLTVQLTLLQEQLQAETAARIESQARVEHLLLQNKELLSHLQKLMWQLQQLQALQMPAASSSSNSKPETPPKTDSSPPSQHSPPPSTDTSQTKPAPAVDPPPSPPSPANEPQPTRADNLVLDLAFSPQLPPTTIDPNSPLSLPPNELDKEILDAAFTPQQSTEDPKALLLASPLSLPPDDIVKQQQVDAAFTTVVSDSNLEPRPPTPEPPKSPPVTSDQPLIPTFPSTGDTVDQQLLDAAFTPH